MVQIMVRIVKGDKCDVVALTAPCLTGLAISISKVLKARFKSNKIQNGRKLAKSG